MWSKYKRPRISNIKVLDPWNQQWNCCSPEWRRLQVKEVSRDGSHSDWSSLSLLSALNIQVKTFIEYSGLEFREVWVDIMNLGIIAGCLRLTWVWMYLDKKEKDQGLCPWGGAGDWAPTRVWSSGPKPQPRAHPWALSLLCPFKKDFIYLFVWLLQVFLASCEIFCWGTSVVAGHGLCSPLHIVS